MSDLSAFLLARITEDEFATLRQRRWPYPWIDIKRPAARRRELARDRRVFMECDAKRHIIALHGRAFEDVQGFPFCSECGSPDDWTVAKLHPEYAWPCDTLRLLALPFADHPDYDETWRP